VHEDYWTIYVHHSLSSCRMFDYRLEFSSYAEAESYLLADKSIVRAIRNYPISWGNKDDVVFQSTIMFMDEKPDGESIPRLYTIHHCIYDHYPYDADVLELTDESIATMKEAYEQVRRAEIYAQRVDWMMSADDSEDTMQVRLKEDLDELEQELSTKDWSCPYEGWEEE